MKILIVDDDVLNRMVLNKLLNFKSTEKHYHTFEATNGLEAVALCEEMEFDLIFMDPPFGKGLIASNLEIIADRGLCQGFLYLESEESETLDELPPSWRVHRQKRAGLGQIARQADQLRMVLKELLAFPFCLLRADVSGSRVSVLHAGIDVLAFVQLLH